MPRTLKQGVFSTRGKNIKVISKCIKQKISDQSQYYQHKLGKLHMKVKNKYINKIC